MHNCLCEGCIAVKNDNVNLCACKHCMNKAFCDIECILFPYTKAIRCWQSECNACGRFTRSTPPGKG